MTTAWETTIFPLTEHLGVDWPVQPVAFALPAGATLPAGSAVTVLNHTTGVRLHGQVDGDGQVWFLTALPAYAAYTFGIDPSTEPVAGVVQVEEDAAAGEYRLFNGAIALAVPRVAAWTAGMGVPAPIRWMQGPEGVRRGCGVWAADGTVTDVSARITAKGPVYAEARVAYRFAGGGDYAITWRLYAGAPVALATEEKTVCDAGVWAFDLAPNFAPDMAQMRWGEKGVWPLSAETDEHICRHIYSNHWDLYQDFKEVSFLYRRDGGAHGDAIGVFPVDGKDWEHVVSNIISLDATAGRGAAYRFSLTPGRREFALFAVPLETTNTGICEPTDGVGAYTLRARWTYARLNAVKAMVLAWDETPSADLDLFVTPERFATLCVRVPAQPDTYGDLAQTSALYSADPEVVQARKEAFFAILHRLRDNAISYGPNDNNSNPVMNRPILHLPLAHAILRRHRALTPEEDRRARAIIAFLAYYTDREDYDFARRAMLPAGDPDDIMTLYKGMRAENMSVDAWAGVGLIGLAYPAHPAAAAWREASLALFERSMEALVAACGAWCEGWGYYRWSLHLMLLYAHAMRRAGTDLFAHPRFKATLGFILEALGPRNPAYGGKRITPGFGSYGESVDFSGCGFSYIMAMAATGYVESDPAFAAALMWAYHEMGEGPLQGNVGLQAHDRELLSLYADYTLPAAEPARASRGCAGFGAIIRDRLADGRENYLIARACHTWPHGHADGGSFFLYYHDVPLVTEAARGTNRENLYINMSSAGHNVLSFDGKPTFQYIWPCRQQFVSFSQHTGLEYAVLDCRVEQLVLGGERRRGHGDALTQAVDIRQYRHLIYVKPDLFVIYDTLAGTPLPSDYRLHFYASEARCTENRAEITGRLGIDVTMTVVHPSAPVFRATPVADTITVEFSNAPNQPYLVVLSPHEAGNEQPVACQWRENRLTIQRGDEQVALAFSPTDTPGVMRITRG